MSGDAQTMPASGLVDRVLRGTLSLWLVTAVNIIGQILTVPIALYAWGASRNGEWIALTALVAYLAHTDLGLQAHVVNRMCAHHARGDNTAVLEDLHSAMRVQWPFVIGLWGVGAIVAYMLPLQRWYHISSASRVEVYLTVILLGAEILIGVAMGPVGGTYRATGRLARSAIQTVIQRIVLYAAPIAMMLAGAGFAAIALARVAWALIVSAYLFYDVPRQNPWFSMWPLRGSVREGLRMLGPSTLFLMAGLADYLALHGTIMVVQSSLGGADVTQLATHRTLVNLGRMVATQFAAATWPELTALEARGQGDLLPRVHRTLAKLNCWLVGAVLLAFLPMARWVYSVWTLKTLSLNLQMFGLMVVQTILWGAWSAGSTVLIATNRQGRLTSILLFNAAVALGISIVLVPKLGILGAAVAGLAADLLIAVWAAPWSACKAIGDKLGGYVREVVPTLLVSLVLPVCAVGALYWVLPWQPVRVVVLPLLGLALGAVALRLMLTPAERRAATHLIARLRARFGLSSGGAA